MLISRFRVALYKNRTAIKAIDRVANDIGAFCHKNNIQIYPQTLSEKTGTCKFLKEIYKELESSLKIGIESMKGKKLVLSDKASKAYPDLKGVKPRGWPPGTTWDNAEGFANIDGVSLFNIRNRRPVSVILPHEIGHIIDFQRNLTTTNKKYIDSYLKDIKNLNKNYKLNSSSKDTSLLDYLVQGSTGKNLTEAGKQEAFAEIYAYQNCGGTGINEVINKLFPNTLNYIKKMCN